LYSADLDREAVGIIKQYTSFFFEEHFCIVFELLYSPLLSQSSIQCTNNGVAGTESAEPALTCLYSPDEIKKVAVQILTALAYLAKHNVIHADLKPENILFRHNNEKGKNVPEGYLKESWTTIAFFR
jgi:serine/threonine protein kinase